MRLCGVPVALLSVFFLFAKANASANATASPTPLEAFSSTGERSTLVSELPNARDDERTIGNEEIGLGTKLATLVTKSKQAVSKPIDDITLFLKLGSWRMKGVDPFIVFTNLKLDHVKENILSNFWFRAWVKYVDGYNSGHPGEEVSIIAKLKGQFDDHSLATMLERAKKEAKPSVRALGRRLQSEQMADWRKHSISPKELHNLLQSDPSHPTLLTDRAYRAWNIYFSELNRGNSMTRLDQLHHTFDDESLSSLLIASKRSPYLATLANKLQLELETAWLVEMVVPEHAFHYLLLDKSRNGILDNLELSSWVRYEEKYRKKTGREVDLMEIMKKIPRQK